MNYFFRAEKMTVGEAIERAVNGGSLSDSISSIQSSVNAALK